jgi:hypothetical protein
MLWTKYFQNLSTIWKKIVQSKSFSLTTSCLVNRKLEQKRTLLRALNAEATYHRKVLKRSDPTFSAGSQGRDHPSIQGVKTWCRKVMMNLTVTELCQNKDGSPTNKFWWEAKLLLLWMASALTNKDFKVCIFITTTRGTSSLQSNSWRKRTLCGWVENRN